MIHYSKHHKALGKQVDRAVAKAARMATRNTERVLVLAYAMFTLGLDQADGVTSFLERRADPPEIERTLG